MTYRSVTDDVTYLSGSSPVIVRVEEPVVNASEGTVAAVCVVAGFPPTFEAFSINEELVTVNISIAAQGSASMYHARFVLYTHRLSFPFYL